MVDLTVPIFALTVAGAAVHELCGQPFRPAAERLLDRIIGSVTEPPLTREQALGRWLEPAPAPTRRPRTWGVNPTPEQPPLVDWASNPELHEIAAAS